MKERLAQPVHDAVINLLIEARKKQGLSQEKLSLAAGLSASYVRHIESRLRKPTLLVCIQLAQALGLPLNEILKKAEAKR